MKKIIILTLSLFCLLSIGSYAQVTKLFATIPSGIGESPSGADSLQNIGTTTSYLYLKVPEGYTAGSIQYYAKRYSASMGGTIYLQVSNDGINYGVTENIATDSITISNAATQSGAINFPATFGVPSMYMRLRCTGASGDTATVRATFYGSRR